MFSRHTSPFEIKFTLVLAFLLAAVLYLINTLMVQPTVPLLAFFFDLGLAGGVTYFSHLVVEQSINQGYEDARIAVSYLMDNLEQAHPGTREAFKSLLKDLETQRL